MPRVAGIALLSILILPHGPAKPAASAFAGATGAAVPPAERERDIACRASEAHEFDFWPGEWKVNNRYLTPGEGWSDAGTADVRVYSALAGCLTIEHWRGRVREYELYGFSVRAWDEERGTWVLLLNWPQPNRPSFAILEGEFRHGRGEFFSESTDADGNPVHTRYSFSDVSSGTFRWDQAFSDDLTRWRTNWIMEYSRRDARRDLPTFIEPAANVARCDDSEHRGFDAVLGEWTGTAELRSDAGELETVPVRLRSVRILGGCAVMDFIETAGASGLMVFRVRSFEADPGRWVTYRYDTAQRVFERLEGQVEGDRARLEGDLAGRGRRIVWQDLASATPGWTYERQATEGTWTTGLRVRLDRRGR